MTTPHWSYPEDPDKVEIKRLSALRDEMREYNKRLKTVAFQAQNAAIDLSKQLAEAQAENAVLRESIEKATDILSTIKKEIPKTMGEFNLKLLMSDITEALGCFNALSRPSSSYLKEWLGEPVAWMTHDGKAVNTDYPFNGDLPLYSPKGLK